MNLFFPVVIAIDSCATEALPRLSAELHERGYRWLPGLLEDAIAALSLTADSLAGWGAK